MNSWITKRQREYLASTMREIESEIEASRERSLAVTKMEEAGHWLRALQERQEAYELSAEDDV